MLDKCNLVHCPWDWDINWMSPVQVKSPPVQVKEPYGNSDMVTKILVGFHPAIQSVRSTPANNTRKRKRVWQYIEEKGIHCN